MRIAIVSESPVDEAAVAILVAGIFGSPIKLVKPPVRLRHFGFSDVPRVIESTLRGSHYMGTSDAIISVLDSDMTIVHNAEHSVGKFHPRCRMCVMTRCADEALRYLTPIEGQFLPRFAAGLAIPSIEAWYLCGIDARVSEAAWVNARIENRVPYAVPQLKQIAYGKSQPTVMEATAIACAAAQRIVADRLLPHLENLFPIGFGTLAAAIRAW